MTQSAADLLPSFDAVIFDVDGTLVDSVDLHAEAWQKTFEQFGHTFAFDAIRSQIGKGGDQLLPVFLPADTVERQGEAIEAHRKDLFSRDYLHRVRGFPAVPDLFGFLLERGKRVALGSSAKGDELDTYKRVAGVEALVDTQTTSDDAERSKPHPDIFEAALERLKMRPARVVVVGDSPWDVEAAGKAGLRTIGLLCGGFAEADMSAAGAVAIYKDPADLLDGLRRG